jgi:hypothetical protein
VCVISENVVFVEGLSHLPKRVFVYGASHHSINHVEATVCVVWLLSASDVNKFVVSIIDFITDKLNGGVVVCDALISAVVYDSVSKDFNIFESLRVRFAIRPQTVKIVDFTKGLIYNQASPMLILEYWYQDSGVQLDILFQDPFSRYLSSFHVERVHMGRYSVYLRDFFTADGGLWVKSDCPEKRVKCNIT